MGNYPVTKLVGLALKLRQLKEKFGVMCSRSQQNLLCFAEDGNEM